MTKIIASIVLMVLTITSVGQSPVKWTFTANKGSGDTCEVHLTATIAAPWHIYSQFTPAGGPLPTSIGLNKNPLFVKIGAAKEIGQLVSRYEPVFNVDIKYYAAKVDFVQLLKLKGKARTRLSGVIQYMACTDKECLAPEKVSFAVDL
jgi:hypothetical protein